MHQPNELLLICCQSAVTRGDRPAEIGDRVVLLQQDRTEAVCGGVALHDEDLGEIRQRQHRGRCHGCLECLEGCLGVIIPGKAFLLQQGSEWCRDLAVVVDEFGSI